MSEYLSTCLHLISTTFTDSPKLPEYKGFTLLERMDIGFFCFIAEFTFA